MLPKESLRLKQQSTSLSRSCQAVVETLEDRRLFAADLTGSFTLVPSALKLTGSNHATFRLDNTGDSVATGSASVALYLSPEPVFESGDTRLLPIAVKPVHLKASGIQNIPMTFASPTGVANGNYYLLGEITPSPAMGDTDTSDKVISSYGTVSVHSAFVDLTGTVTKSIAAPVTVVTKHQKSASATITVTNNGNVAAKGKLIIDLYAATHTTLNSSDKLLLSKSIGNVSIAAGKSRTFAMTLMPSATDPSGTFYLLADVNPTGAISEDDSGNNISSSAAEFRVSNPAIAAGPYFAGALSSSVTSVSTNVSQQTTFQIFVGRADASTAVEIDEFDASGDDLGEIAPLVDDGDSTQGDTLANDGIYTGVASIDSTAVGTRYFAAVVTDPQMEVAKTSPVISITATAPQAPTLTSALSANFSKLAVNTSEETTFHVSVANSNSSTIVYVDEFDASGNNLGEFTQLYDDGSAANGDLVAGDGIFSGINAVGFMAPGTRYFAPVVSDDSLSAPLKGTVLSIIGATAPTPAQLQNDESDANSVESAANNVFASGGSVSSALSALSSALNSDTNVDQASIAATANNVAWDTTDGIPFIYDTTDSTGQVKGAGGGPSEQASTNIPAASVGAQPADTSSSDLAGNAIVLDPFEWDFGSYDEAGPIGTMLASAGYSVTTLQNTTKTATNVSLSSFTNLGAYDAVIISTHGGLLSGGGEFFLSGVPVDNSTSAQVNDLWNKELVNASIHDNPGVQYYGITPSFIADNTATSDGTIVYASACYSAADGQMASAFTNKGIAAYIGYTDEVQAPFAYNHGIAAFTTLLGSTNNTVGNIPGINVDINNWTDDAGVAHAAQFVADFGQSALDATLPQGLLLKNYEFYVQYNWPQNVSDLDTRTTFLGTSVGWSLSGGSDYITWSGDNTSAGGDEWDTVNLYQAYLDGQIALATTTPIGIGCDWYSPAGGSGPASITIELKNISTGAVKEVSNVSVDPGQEDGGSPDTQYTVDLMIGGTSANPTVSISVSAGT